MNTVLTNTNRIFCFKKETHMTQDMVGSYTVQQREKVTIEVVATKVGEFVKAALDGVSLTKTGSAPVQFKFPVTKSSGTHFVNLEFRFDGNPPDDATYQIFVQGNMGGGRFQDSTVPKSDPALSRDLAFSVA